jgi:DNA polymerase I
MESLQMQTLDFKETYKWDWMTLLNRAQFVALDTETNGKDLFKDPDARVNGFSLAVKIDGEYFKDYFPVAHIRGKNLPTEDWTLLLVAAQTKTQIYHNSIFDLRALELLAEYAFLPTDKFQPENFIDTMQLAHIHNENFGKTDGGYSLDACTLRYLGYKGKKKSMDFEMMLILVGWNGIDFGNIREYAEEDAYITYLLWEAIITALDKQNEQTVTDYWKKIEAPNLKVLKDYRTLGVKVNIPLAEEMEATGIEIMRGIEKETGYKFEGPGSRKAMEQLFWHDLKMPVVFKKTKDSNGNVTEKPTLDKDAMERYEVILETRDNPIAKKVLEFRGWQKSVTAFYRPYQTFVDSDGRIRTDFKPHGTVTGRFSSSKPNLQQIPKESNKPWNGKVKECFMPEDGYELWEFDYSQLEFRLAASYAREPKLLDVFNDDSRDIFNEMSIDLGLERQKCKTLTYSIQYGAGVQRIMDVFGYSQADARATIAKWYANYPGIRRVNDKAEADARKNGKIELWSGRYRHFQYPRSEARKAFNSAIQGGAADIVKCSMNNVKRELPEVRQILQVHDALWFELPIGSAPKYCGDIARIMEHPIDSDRVHFKVEGKRVGTLL